MVNKCLFCSAVLEKTEESREHIIPNALGGRLKSKKLICRRCNSSFGNDCDGALAKSFNFFANFLNIKREKGEPQMVEGATPDRAYSLDPGGKPVLKIPEIKTEEADGMRQINIRAKDLKTARQVLEGLKRKNPSLDVEKALASAATVREYETDFVKIKASIGGSGVLRAIAKILYLLAEHRSPGLMKGSAKVADFIKGTADYRDIYFYFPPAPFVDSSEDQVLHTLLIKSYPDEKLLLGFVELFGVASFVCVLLYNYSESFELAYVYDVIERSEIPNPKINIPALTKLELRILFDRLNPPFDQIKSRFGWFLNIADKYQTLEHLGELAERAVRNSLMKHPEGTPITQEMFDEFIQAYEDELTAFLVARLKREEDADGAL